MLSLFRAAKIMPVWSRIFWLTLILTGRSLVTESKKKILTERSVFFYWLAVMSSWVCVLRWKPSFLRRFFWIDSGYLLSRGVCLVTARRDCCTANQREEGRGVNSLSHCGVTRNRPNVVRFCCCGPRTICSTAVRPCN